MVEFEYTCPVHRVFTVEISIHDEIPQWSLCSHMDEHDHEGCLNELPCKYTCMESSPLRFITK